MIWCGRGGRLSAGDMADLAWSRFGTAEKSFYIPRFHRLTKKLAGAGASDSCRGMIRGGFLDPGTRADLIALVRDGKAETRLTRRANALLLLDDGMSCAAIAKVLYLDDDTIRYWYQLSGEKGLNWLADFGYKGRRSEERRVGNECRSVV